MKYVRQSEVHMCDLDEDEAAADGVDDGGVDQVAALKRLHATPWLALVARL